MAVNQYGLKLSIITVNLNNAAGLRRTVESVVAQTSRDFEYIVIDGGSTDGSMEVISEFKDRITWWVSEPDGGIYAGMNKGIRAASGTYCQFLNSGDRLAGPGVIERMLATLPDCAIYYGNMLKEMPGGKLLRDHGCRGEVTMFTFYRGTLNHSPALIKRSLFDRYGLYDETLRIVSDWKFYLVTVGLHNEPVRYTDTDVTIFEMTGISNTNRILEKEERRKTLEELLPASILADYDLHHRSIEQATRLNRCGITKFMAWLLDRLIFKYEKLCHRR